LLTLGGIAAPIGIGILIFKRKTPLTLDEVQKYFSEIFKRDLSKDETQTIIQRYQEIMKKDAPEEFCTKLFNEVKKNFGYKDTDLKLTISRTKKLSEP